MTCRGGADARATVGRLVDWFRRDGADLPWRRTRDRYLVLVAETQLQATPVARVLPFYLRFAERWPTAERLAGADLGEVLAAWQGLGYPRRARNLHAAAGVIARDGWPPADRLTDLPGVGPYTAAAHPLLRRRGGPAAGRHQRGPGGGAPLPGRLAGGPGARLGGRAGGDGPRSPVVHRARPALRRRLPPARGLSRRGRREPPSP